MIKVKEKQDGDSNLLQVKDAVHKKKVEIFFLEENGIIRIKICCVF